MYNVHVRTCSLICIVNKSLQTSLSIFLVLATLNTTTLCVSNKYYINRKCCIIQNVNDDNKLLIFLISGSLSTQY